MRITPRLLILAGIAVLSVGVIADTVPTAIIPDSYFLGQAPQKAKPAAAETAKPAAIEKPQALNGALYAVIAPTYTGTGGTQSFIRLFNGGAAATNFSVTVVGSPSARTYGVANISVPPRASPQIPLLSGGGVAGILELANAAALNGGDTGYALYIQSTEPTAGYQHITFNTGNLFFENVSVCHYLLNQTVRSVVNSVVLTNIHTSLFGSYPSQIDLHNYWNTTKVYRFTVINAGTGDIIGQTDVSTAANSSYSLPFTFFEQQLGWNPAGVQHINLVITDPNATLPAVVVGQSIVNAALSANINMTTACAVNAPVDPNSGGDGGFGGGGISY